MAARTKLKLSDEVRDILARSTIVGKVVKLPEQLDRATYEAVNKALAAAGGKWDRKSRGHVFASNPAEVLGLAVSVGEVTDKKKGSQAYYSPPEVVKAIFEQVDVGPQSYVLEPSAGHGAIARAAVARGAFVTCVDIDPDAYDVLLKDCEINGVHRGDFLTMNPDRLGHFDYVLMNPPFSKGQDIDHVMHAVNFLRTGGALVAVMSAGAVTGTTRRHRDFADFRRSLGDRCAVYPLPDDSFKSSGTSVRTILFVIR